MVAVNRFLRLNRSERTGDVSLTEAGFAKRHPGQFTQPQTIGEELVPFAIRRHNEPKGGPGNSGVTVP